MTKNGGSLLPGFTNMAFWRLISIFFALLAFSTLSTVCWFKFKLPDRLSLFPDALLGNGAMMGGLLPYRPEGDKCLARLQHHLYPGSSNYRPSRYLVSKLRQYEERHRRCAKEAENFSQVLASGGNSSNMSSSTDCKFVVWINYQGLGNKYLTIVSAFLYALMTDRVFLMDRGSDNMENWCEPFPGTSMFVPENFPHSYFGGMHEGAPNRYGTLLEAAGSCEASRKVETLPSILYVHIAHNSNAEDKRFFCQPEQERVTSQVSWLFMRADVYFMPQLYFVPFFRKEIDKLFPDHETIFRYTARYLLNPANTAWSMAKRSYDTYLRGGDLVVGIQIRPFDGSAASLNVFSNQLMDCISQKGILPNVTHGREEETWLQREASTDIRVLVVSLQQTHYDKLKEMYIRYPAKNNARVQLQFVSHEEHQQTDAKEHDLKALTEMYLLSMCDELVTSPRSTFGYVGNALGGVRPWTLKGEGMKPWNLDWPVPENMTCYRMNSVEPCYILGPLYDCDCKGDKPAPEGVRSCQDFPLGLKFTYAT